MAPREEPSQPTPPPANPAQSLRPGQFVMAKTFAQNAQWQVCKVLDGLVIEFPDGAQYAPDAVMIGGTVAPQVPPATTQPAMSATGLNQGFEAFKQQVVQLEEVAQANFQLPLEAVLMMARRQALANRMMGTGTMDVINGQPLFVPDVVTLGAWLDAYLSEVQRKLQGGSPE